MDRQSPFANIHQRDDLLHTLSQLAVKFPDRLRTAASHLNGQLEAIVESQRAKARKSVKLRLTMLEVARQYVLDSLNGPPALCANSSLDTEGDLPAGFNPVCLGVHGPLPEWMKRCHEYAGEFDYQWVEMFQYYLGYAWNLHNGTWGEWSFPRPVDLTQLTAADMWLLQQTRPLSKDGKPSRAQSDLEHWEADTDADAAARHAENHVGAMSDLVYDMLDELESPVTTDRAWEILLLTLLLMDPNFDPETAGIRGMPQWEFGEEGNWWRARSFPMFVWQDRSSNLELVCELAYRAARAIEPTCISVVALPLTQEELGLLLKQITSRKEFADAVKALISQSTPPAAWTRTKLCEITGVTPKTLTRIREHTTLAPLEQGQRDIVYGPPEVKLLITAARTHSQGKQEWANVADKLETMLKESGFLAT